jgi:hypothetical protein
MSDELPLLALNSQFAALTVTFTLLVCPTIPESQLSA